MHPFFFTSTNSAPTIYCTCTAKHLILPFVLRLPSYVSDAVFSVSLGLFGILLQNIHLISSVIFHYPLTPLPSIFQLLSIDSEIMSCRLYFPVLLHYYWVFSINIFQLRVMCVCVCLSSYSLFVSCSRPNFLSLPNDK